MELFHKTRSLKKKWKFLIGASLIFVIWIIVIPMPKLSKPLSTVVYSCEGELLGARIATDGQWRFPSSGQIPANYKKALLLYEDRMFYFHPGINPFSLGRALFQYLKYKRYVSGGSTLSMQVARLSRGNKTRNIPGKILEMNMALKLELLTTKSNILTTYASSAPFGGNVVGIEAASWRYFNRPPEMLTWAEAALLAVLPNAPSLLYPGKNSELLIIKRNTLLKKLYAKGVIDQLTYEVSIAEPLPFKPLPLPSLASHIVDKMNQTKKGEKVVSTLKIGMQQQVSNVVKRHQTTLKEYGIHNISVIIATVDKGEIIAYLGNTEDLENKHGGKVDIAISPRSSGSILKPFLYAAMLHSGEILPHTLIADIPVNFSGFSPKNYDFSYSGAVKASEALGRSLNIPAVEMLHQFGEARFLDVLRNCGFTTFPKPAGHYGLSLILGGGETTLIELAGAYASLARVLKNYETKAGYCPDDFFPLSYLHKPSITKNYTSQPTLSASAIWFTLEALLEVNRPTDRSGWQHYSSTEKIAWKTGTSFGYRDAWAVATTPEYVVAVWAGNSNGEGRPGLTGVQTAAPILFDIIDFMPPAGWFKKPEADIATIALCPKSGMRASQYCTQSNESEVPLPGLKTQACPYHQLVHLSADRCWQVNSSCYPVAQMLTDSLFILPPAMEWYYRKIHPEYKTLPPLMPGCSAPGNRASLELLFPRNLSRIFIPNELDGSKGKVVFEAAHRNMDTNIYWHLDDEFIAVTKKFHQIAIAPQPGEHYITLIDETGLTLRKRFYIISGNEK